MALRTVIGKTTKYALGAGVIYASYESGLWKSADETIENYEKIKTKTDEYLSSVPVVHEIWGDLSKFANRNVLEPVKETVSSYTPSWLSSISATSIIAPFQNKDGIIKPTWNKAVVWTFDTLAYSPETIKSWSKKGWNKLSDFMNSTETSTTTTTTAVVNTRNVDANVDSESKAKQ